MGIQHARESCQNKTLWLTLQRFTWDGSSWTYKTSRKNYEESNNEHNIPAKNKKQCKAIRERNEPWVTLWLVIGRQLHKTPFTITRPNHSCNSVSLECVVWKSCNTDVNRLWLWEQNMLMSSLRGLIQEKRSRCKIMAFLYLSIPHSASSHG